MILSAVNAMLKEMKTATAPTRRDLDRTARRYGYRVAEIRFEPVDDELQHRFNKDEFEMTCTDIGGTDEAVIALKRRVK